MMMPAIRYATTVDGLSIAYQELGEGGIDVVYLPGTVSHLEMAWEFDGRRHLMERFSTFSRFVKFDKRGTGLSDRSMGTGTPEARIDDVRAVMDDIGIHRAVVLGHSEGGTLAALFAALHPDRVERLILYNAYAYGPLCENHPRPEPARRVADRMLERLARELGFGPCAVDVGRRHHRHRSGRALRTIGVHTLRDRAVHGNQLPHRRPPRARRHPGPHPHRPRHTRPDHSVLLRRALRRANPRRNARPSGFRTRQRR